MSISEKHSNTGHVMKDYGSRVVGLAQLAELSAPLITTAIDGLPTSASSPFVIADYGCADGSQNMHIFSNIIKLARHKYGEQLPILVCHEDQDGNDFNSLFKWVVGKDSTASYAAQHSNVFVMASATGFYSQCFPSNFVDFGFTCLTLHWLSKLPTQIKNDISHQLNKATDDEISAFKHQAAADWERFLLNRAKELRPGGQLVITSICYTGTSDRAHLTIVSDLWKSLIAEQIITEEEFEATNFPWHSRTVEEYKAPFEDQQSTVARAGLRLVHITDSSLWSPINRDLEKVNDAELKVLGASAARAISSWSSQTFYDGLSQKRSAEEKKAIVDNFFARLEQSMAQPANLGRYKSPLLAMLIEKCAHTN